MIDVLPLSIGLEKASGAFEVSAPCGFMVEDIVIVRVLIHQVLLAKNTRVPATVTKYFELDRPDQKLVEIKVSSNNATKGWEVRLLAGTQGVFPFLFPGIRRGEQNSK